MMKPGTRVVFISHPEWRGGDLRGYEGIVCSTQPTHYVVKVPWMTRLVYAVPEIVCPVYNDCACGNAAFTNRNEGDDKHPAWVHYCLWCVPESAKL